MQFANQLAFLLIPILLLFLWALRRTRHTLLFKSRARLTRLPKPIRVVFRGPVLGVLYGVGFLALTIALARPQHGTKFTETEESGRDIVVAVDSSGSMKAMDFQLEGNRVNRLTALKSVVTEFVERRRGDRVGLVVFGDEAFVQCPLTNDTFVLKEFISALEIGMAGEQTAIGDALAISLKMLREIKSESKVIVLVTDGANTAGSITPLEAATLAADLGMRVHTIGIGGNSVAPFPVRTFYGQTRLINRQVRFDEETLRDIADKTGGKYYLAANTDQLQNVYKEIDRLEERIAKSYVYVEYEEQFELPLILGFSLLALALLLQTSVFATIP